jgi:hypothetical protein
MTTTKKKTAKSDGLLPCLVSPNVAEIASPPGLPKKGPKRRSQETA